jgi:hypothetical protein
MNMKQGPAAWACGIDSGMDKQHGFSMDEQISI